MMRNIVFSCIFVFVQDIHANGLELFSNEKVLLHDDSWAIEKEEIDPESRFYKNQTKSLTDWNQIDPEKWLDFERWKRQRELRDQKDSWKQQLRDVSYKEKMAKVFKCVGECRVFDGLQNFASFRNTYLKEGHELTTGDNSYAWIVLADGGILRLSPKSSLSLVEFNLSEEKAFLSLRLNEGHLYYGSRNNGAYEPIDRPETDQLFYPFIEKEINREYFARKEYQEANNTDRVILEIERNLGHMPQVEILNQKLNKNIMRSADILIYTENAHFLSKNTSFQIAHHIGLPTYFKAYKDHRYFKKKDKRVQSVLSLQENKFGKFDEIELQDNVLYKTDLKQEIISLKMPLFSITESFVDNIPAVWLYREMVLENSFSYQFKSQIKEFELAQNFGLRLWSDKENIQREEFVFEYLKRLERTNRKMIKKLKIEKEDKWDKVYYQYALNKHLIRLKELYGPRYKVVRELNDLDFRIWLVKYAKI